MDFLPTRPQPRVNGHLALGWSIRFPHACLHCVRPVLVDITHVCSLT
jgi:hypothetical protein